MPLFCKKCDITGTEKLAPNKGSFTLESCKQACRDDSECYGIDFGFDNKKCYLTTVPIPDGAFGSHNSYDGYRKTSCGTGMIKIIFVLTYTCILSQDMEKSK